MYKAIIDSNIFIDFMFHREPFYKESEKIIGLCENKKIKGYVTTSILMDLHYIFRKFSHSNKTANQAIMDILNVFSVIEISEKDINMSISQNSGDFEDLVIENSSIRNRMDLIITRNIKDFKNEKIIKYSPKEILQKIDYGKIWLCLKCLLVTINLIKSYLS